MPATHNETILEGALALSAFLAQNHTKQKKAPRLPEENPAETDDYPPNSQQNAQQQRQNPLLDIIGGKQANDDPNHLWDTCPQSHKSNYRHRYNQDGSYPTIKPDANTDIKSNEAYQKTCHCWPIAGMVGNHHAASYICTGKSSPTLTAEFAAKLSRRAQINPTPTALPIQPTAIQRGPMSLPIVQNPADTGKPHPRPLQNRNGENGLTRFGKPFQQQIAAPSSMA